MNTVDNTAIDKIPKAIPANILQLDRESPLDSLMSHSNTRLTIYTENLDDSLKIKNIITAQNKEV